MDGRNDEWLDGRRYVVLAGWLLLVLAVIVFIVIRLTKK
jgi:hypothetical protein